MTDEVYSYGGTVSYRPVLDSMQLRTPIPKPARVGDWVHIPYSSINAWETDSGVQQTVWQVRIWLPAAADYTALEGLYGSFAALGAPFWSGTRQALLREMGGFQVDNYGEYRGSVTWELSNQ